MATRPRHRDTADTTATPMVGRTVRRRRHRLHLGRDRLRICRRLPGLQRHSRQLPPIPLVMARIQEAAHRAPWLIPPARSLSRRRRARTCRPCLPIRLPRRIQPRSRRPARRGIHRRTLSMAIRHIAVRTARRRLEVRHTTLQARPAAARIPALRQRAPRTLLALRPVRRIRHLTLAAATRTEVVRRTRRALVMGMRVVHRILLALARLTRLARRMRQGHMRAVQGTRLVPAVPLTRMARRTPALRLTRQVGTPRTAAARRGMGAGMHTRRVLAIRVGTTRRGRSMVTAEGREARRRGLVVRVLRARRGLLRARRGLPMSRGTADG